jgi:hypothetical protein
MPGGSCAKADLRGLRLCRTEEVRGGCIRHHKISRRTDSSWQAMVGGEDPAPGHTRGVHHQATGTLLDHASAATRTEAAA